MAAETPLARTLTAAVNLAQAGRVGDAIGMLAGGANGALVHPGARNVLGVLYLQNGQTAEALASFDEAVRLAPRFADAHCNRGVALQKLSRYVEALAAYDAAVKFAPRHALALFNRGNVLRLLGQLDEAVVAFGQALKVEPKLAEAYLNRGHVQMARRDYAAALSDFEATVALKADSHEARAGRISALVSLGRFEAALAAADEATTHHPSDADIAAIRGQILLELDRPDEALATVDGLSGSRPLVAKAQIVRSAALWQQGRLEEAIAAARESVRLGPDDPQTHQGLAHMSLAVGDFARGFAENEYRGDDDPSLVAFNDQAPRWAGEDVAGKTVLVFAEQGLGDTIQFARYVGLLAERGAMVKALVQPPILRLMKSIPAPVAWNIAMGAVGPFDFQIPLLSLPRVFGTLLETIPAAVPYLHAEADRVGPWKDMLGSGGFKIGMVWQGNPVFKNDRRRSVPLENFAPLSAIPDVRLISLQAIHGLDQLTRLPAGMEVETLGAKITDNPEGLDEISAVMMNLDLVVTSDTAAAHLAAALGRPVWVALSHDPDWRWLRDRADSPWYPSMRLFRQQRPGDWPGVFAKIAAALRELVARS
jgi:tetratricopeptide (TPR) repeat protein